MIFDVLVTAIPLILAITLHEAAHGYVAELFGDSTARRAGRISLNPLRHIDPVGTLLLPGLLFLAQAPFLFGYARPVPVDFSQLRPRSLGMALVALAGPGMNIFLALTALLAIKGLDSFFTLSLTTSSQNYGVILEGLARFVQLNIFLAVFNMIPVLPLDGGRVVVAAIPAAFRDRIAPFLARLELLGMTVVIGFAVGVPYLSQQFLKQTLNPLGDWLHFASSYILRMLMALIGLN